MLDLYLDDTLDLAFPDGSEGIKARPDYENAFFFVRDESLRDQESQRWATILGSFHSHACRNGRRGCSTEEQSSPYAYARHLLPGLALQSYSLSCSALDPKLGPTEMWLLRQGKPPAELHPPSGKPEATYRFAMPTALFELAAPHTRKAVEYYENTPLKPAAPMGEFTVPPK